MNIIKFSYQKIIYIFLSIYFLAVPFDFFTSNLLGRAITTYFSVFLIILFMLYLFKIKTMSIPTPFVIMFIYFMYILINILIKNNYYFDDLFFLIYYAIFTLIFLNLYLYSNKKLLLINISYILGLLLIIVLFNEGFQITKGRLLYRDLNNYINPNSLSVYFIIGIINVYLANRSLKKFKKINLFLGILYFILLILTQSRTAVFSFLFSVIITIFFINFSYIISIISTGIIKIQKINIFKKIAIILFLLFFLFLIFNNFLNIERFNILEKDIDTLTAGRTKIWENAIRMVDDPFLGVGFGVLSNEYRPAHNIYIGAYSETGIIGLLLLLLFLLSNFLYLKNANIFKKNNFIPIFILVYILISGLGNDVIYYKYFWLLYIIFYLSIINLKRNKYNL